MKAERSQILEVWIDYYREKLKTETKQTLKKWATKFANKQIWRNMLLWQNQNTLSKRRRQNEPRNGETSSKRKEGMFRTHIKKGNETDTAIKTDPSNILELRLRRSIDKKMEEEPVAHRRGRKTTNNIYILKNSC